ncbi:MAG: hypothetical protein ACYDEX_15795 [Mobilitalea sp.]
MFYGFSKGINGIIAEGVLFALLALTFSSGIINARRKRAGKKSGFVIPIRIVLPFSLVVLLVILLLSIWVWNKV